MQLQDTELGFMTYKHESFRFQFDMRDNQVHSKHTYQKLLTAQSFPLPQNFKGNLNLAFKEKIELEAVL